MTLRRLVEQAAGLHRFSTHRNQALSRPAFTVFIRTLCEGMTPAWRDSNGYPWIYETELEAQREIAETQVERLQQFLSGERDFDDAIETEDFVMPVEVWPDRSITLDDGTRFGRDTKGSFVWSQNSTS